MSLRHHLSFANLASGTALLIAVTGGGVAVAAGLAANTVGSPQIKNGAVRSVDVGANAVTGADVRESSLGKVRSAASVDSVRTIRKNVAVGTTVGLVRQGAVVVEASCVQAVDGFRSISLRVLSTAEGTVADSLEQSPATLSPGVPYIAASATEAGAPLETFGFTVVTPSGAGIKAVGFVYANNSASGRRCLAELTVIR